MVSLRYWCFHQQQRVKRGPRLTQHIVLEREFLQRCQSCRRQPKLLFVGLLLHLDQSSRRIRCRAAFVGQKVLSRPRQRKQRRPQRQEVTRSTEPLDRELQRLLPKDRRTEQRRPGGPAPVQEGSPREPFLKPATFFKNKVT